MNCLSQSKIKSGQKQLKAFATGYYKREQEIENIGSASI